MNAVLARLRRDRISLLTGPSGCGKSTLLYLAAGIYPHHGGRVLGGKVEIEGVNPASLPPRERAALVGMLFQNPDLQFCMDTVENELLFCLGNARVPRDEMPSTLGRALSACGIEHLRSRLLRTLSGGEKQMVALACVLVHEPAWLLLDEPFANVDDATAAGLVRLIERIHRTGTGIVVVDHRVDQWDGIASDFWRFDSGNALVPVTPGEMDPVGGARENRWREFFQRTRIGSRRVDERRTRLSLQDVSVQWDGRGVLDHVSYDFNAGGVYALTGRSGSGKSTLFDALLGAVPHSGDVLLDGLSLGRRARLSAGSVGFVAQNPQDQFVADTVAGEIRTSLVGAAGSRDGIDSTVVEQVLRPIGLWGHREFSPYMLSQGQQRRLGVAALMTYDCKVLVCDEPTYGQDEAHAMAIMEALLAIARARGVTLLFSTHDEVMANQIADVVLRLEGGRLHEVNQSVV